MTGRDLVSKKRDLLKQIETLDVYLSVLPEGEKECVAADREKVVAKVDKINLELLKRSKRIGNARELEAFIEVYIKDSCQAAAASKLGFTERRLRQMLSSAMLKVG